MDRAWVLGASDYFLDQLGISYLGALLASQSTCAPSGPGTSPSDGGSNCMADGQGVEPGFPGPLTYELLSTDSAPAECSGAAYGASTWSP